MGSMVYEINRAEQVEKTLISALDAGDLEAFKAEYSAHALRYLNKKRRNPLYLRFMELMKERNAK